MEARRNTVLQLRKQKQRTRGLYEKRPDYERIGLQSTLKFTGPGEKSIRNVFVSFDLQPTKNR